VWTASADVRTRSFDNGDLAMHRTETKFGERTFIVGGPVAWNSLPRSIRNSHSANSFKTAPKTFLFSVSNWLVYILARFVIFSAFACTEPLNRSRYKLSLFFTALHGMQMGSSDEYSVCPYVRPSVRPSVRLSVR